MDAEPELHDAFQGQPYFKTVTVTGRPGRYGWSRRLRRGENCIVARFEGGDLISEWELGAYMRSFAKVGRITQDQSMKCLEAIGRLDSRRGSVRDLKAIRALARALGMRVRMNRNEVPLKRVKPGAYDLTYWEAYGIARSAKANAPGLEVRVRRVGGEPVFPPGMKEPKSRPGGYAVSFGPVPPRPREPDRGADVRRKSKRMGPDDWFRSPSLSG